MFDKAIMKCAILKDDIDREMIEFNKEPCLLDLLYEETEMGIWYDLFVAGQWEDMTMKQLQDLLYTIMDLVDTTK